MTNPLTVATVLGIVAILYGLAVLASLCVLWILCLEEERPIAHRAATTSGRTRKAKAATGATSSGPRHARSTWKPIQPDPSE